MTLMASSGLVTFTDLTDSTSGSISFSVTAGALKPATTSPVPVSPGTASKLLIQTQPAPTAIAGQPLANQPVIELLDQFGNLVQSDDGKVVTAQLGSGTGPLEGTLTAKLSHGVATFTDLAENKAGTISLKFTGDGISSLSSAPIVVSPASASKLVIDTQPASSATAGQAFAIDPVVSLEDQYSNKITGDNGTAVTVSLASGSGPLHGTLTATVTGGVATFTDLFDDKAETTCASLYKQALATATSTNVDVSPAAAGKLLIAAQPSATATAGQTFETQPVVYLEDQYGNVLTGDNSTVVTVSVAGGAGQLQGTQTATVRAGVARFANLGDSSAETITLKFTAGSLSSPATSPIQVAPKPPPPNPTPTVLRTSVLVTPKTKRKKATFSGFSVQYSTAMNQATIAQTTNYVLMATIKGNKRKPVKFAATYDPSTSSVILKIKGTNPFAKGGTLTIVASPPTGVSSQAGVFLSSTNTVFRIGNKGKSIVLG